MNNEHAETIATQLTLLVRFMGGILDELQALRKLEITKAMQSSESSIKVAASQIAQGFKR